MSKICELCCNKYEDEMIINKKYCDFNQCYDCLFSMNFNNKDIINGSMGIKLSDYIKISLKYHMEINEIPCSRLTDRGGCYICMKILDIPLDIATDSLLETTSIEKEKENKNIERITTHNISVNNIDELNIIKNDNIIIDL